VALIAAGELQLDHPKDLDAEDWWYRCHFASDSASPVRMTFEGLATVADVWLNGRLVLQSESMFVARTVDVSGAIRAHNELVMRFRALAPLLAARRPRPRWRTHLASHQSLRWYRTSLLGRMPAWCPQIAPVGPWRPVLIESSRVRIERADVHARVHGDDGLVVVRLYLRHEAAGEITGTVSVSGFEQGLERVRQIEDLCELGATIRLPRPRRWWPHTHGSPFTYDVRASITGSDVVEAVDLGRVGFRTLELDRGGDGDGFGLVVNGVPVFCRGVCWTPLDLTRLSASASGYRAALERLRAAGVNMIRIPGTMTYETRHFYDLCDDLGVLVWQDLMFASMDYPWSDPRFADDATLEAQQVLLALQSRPSVAVICGNSEVDQQAAMLGLSGEARSNRTGDERLTALAQEIVPGVVWMPSTPSGGTFPFQVNVGVSHYYGVGAYRRPLDDARRAGVRFAAECLGFSNVPDQPTVFLVLPDGTGCGHDPRWKVRVPRDGGAAWDFEEVRDDYLERLFGVSAATLRSRDPQRYLALARIATAEVMQRTFSEWRRPGSTCRGGLVWFAQDLAPGAGWGIVDSTGRPKAAYWYLRRVFAPTALFFADEGLNGLWLHAVNDSAAPAAGDLQLTLYRDGLPYGQRSGRPIELAPHGSLTLHADAQFDGFRDLTDAYRFGPFAHHVVAATLRDRATGELRAEAYYFPGTLPADAGDLGLSARIEPLRNEFVLHLETERFAHAVSIEFDQFTTDDNYVNVQPGQSRCIRLTARVPGTVPRGTVSSLNGDAVPIQVEPAHVS
jgi:beta-mannosidase